MFCEKCGTQLPDHARFCGRCGAAQSDWTGQGIQGAGENRPGQTVQAVYPAEDYALPEGISRDEQGAYHWAYRVDMRENPAPLIVILKVFIGVSFGIGLLLGMIFGFDDGLAVGIKTFLGIGFGGSIGFTPLVLIAWKIYLWVHGRYFMFEYVMDEDKVVVLQTQEERERSQKFAKVMFVLSLLERDSSDAVSGMLAIASQRVDSDYSDVRKVIADRRHHQIKVNNLLMHNVVFAEPHQYDFVFDYLAAHCTKAKIKR